ncbi:MAG TPA: FAD:protein FMN transferase [Burkholderiaceae bacterium]|jgi:thiamine biosynthesis lipoprotein
MQARVLVPWQITGTPPALGQSAHQLQGATMGTGWSVQLIAPTELQIEVIEAAIVRVLDEVIAQMSHWEPDSLLSRFNRSEAGSQHALPEGFATVMDAALHVARASDGAFDPTAGALVQRWGFGPPGVCLPASCDWRALAWEGRRLTQNGALQLDLSAIAKGYAVDRVSQALHGCGIDHHLVDIGGELRGAGVKPDGQPWWVDLEPPDAGCALDTLRIALHGLSIATSGDYRRFSIDAAGKRLSHSIDPRTGEPIAHGLASVSVVHESAMWADGWSTALMVMGGEVGLRFATEHQLAARFIQRVEDGGFAESMSPAMLELLA